MSLRRPPAAAAAIVTLLAAGAGGAAGCVAPMGVGTGAVQVPRGHVAAGGGIGFGAAASREQFQADLSSRFQVREAFSVETGAVYTVLRDRDGDRTLVFHSAMPYARPAIHMGGATLGVALSGFGAGGGGGGFGWGMLEPRVGYGGHRWSVYAAWLRHVALAVGGDRTTEVSAEHWRLGGDWYVSAEGLRLGLAAQVMRGDDRIYRSNSGTWAERYTMGVLSVRLHWNGR